MGKGGLLEYGGSRDPDGFLGLARCICVSRPVPLPCRRLGPLCPSAELPPPLISPDASLLGGLMVRLLFPLASKLLSSDIVRVVEEVAPLPDLIAPPELEKQVQILYDGSNYSEARHLYLACILNIGVKWFCRSLLHAMLFMRLAFVQSRSKSLKMIRLVYRGSDLSEKI